MRNTVHETAPTDLPRRVDGSIDLNVAAHALLCLSSVPITDERPIDTPLL